MSKRERKVVSVIFCDLVGFTAASEEADPEDVDAGLRAYHAAVRAEIERFGGTVEKFIGDAVMAVFGAPRAHEDDPERAVRAALAILDTVDVEVRVAVNTGEALVRLDAHPEQGEGMVAGDVVNTAARLQAAAPAGAVVVGEATRAATERVVESEPLPAVAVKGKAAPVGLWRAVAPRSGFGVDADAPAAAAFVGRDADVALLAQTFERTLAGAGTQLVTIAGEPGVGKTRLVRELAAIVDAREELVNWRQGRCLPYGDGIAYSALAEVVKAHCGILESDAAEDADRKLRASLAGIPDADWVRAMVAPLVGLEGSGADREAAFAAWRAFLDAIASERPLVLVVEDLHWADPAMLEFLDYLTEWGRDLPLLVVCTARPELYESHPGWSGGKRNAATISLAPLSDADTARLIAALTGRSVISADAQAVLLERAGGNPLYAEEFVRMLEETGGDAARMPAGLQAVIAARLDTLDADRKAVLHDAAVVGKVFWAGTVAAMGSRDAPAVADALRELARRELVKPARTSSVQGEQEYAFWHALVRDVAYSQIPRGERSERHVAAARWIEGLAGERVADRAEMLAHHYLEALDLARAGGAPTAGLEAQSARFAVLAAERLAGIDAGAAARMYERAVEVMPEGTVERAQAGAELAIIRVTNGADAQVVQADLARAEADANRADDPAAVAAVLLAKGAVAYLSGDADAARALRRASVDALAGQPPSALAARAMAATAWDAMTAGQGAEAVERADAALVVARAVDSDIAAILALNTRGIARSELLGDPGWAEDFDAASTIADARGGHLLEPNTLGNRSDCTWAWDGPAAALGIKRTAIDLARRRGSLANVAWMTAELVWPLFDLGRWDEILVIADESDAWVEAHGATQLGPIAAGHRVGVLALRGDPGMGRACDALLAALEAQSDPQTTVPALTYAAQARLAQGRAAEARDLIGRLLPGHPAAFVTLSHVCRVCIACGDLALADAHVDDDRPRSRRGANGVIHARAVVLEARGQHGAALAGYLDAAARWESFPHVYEHAQALLGAARCETALGDTAAAAAHDARAEELLAGLGVKHRGQAPMFHAAEEIP